MDMSTCGLLHSVGSDVTRTKGRSDIHQSGSFRSEQAISKAKLGNTPTSRAGVSVPSKRVLHPLIIFHNSLGFVAQ